MKVVEKKIYKICVLVILFIAIISNVVYSDDVSKSSKNINKQEVLEETKDHYWFLPDLIMFQTAGYIGYFVGGFGYNFFDNHLETIISYGYVPENIGGKKIHTFAFKNSFYPFKLNINKNIEIAPFYMGITALFALDRNLYWEYSTDCPKFYYPPTGTHLALNIGTQVTVYTKNTFFVELSMLDTYAKAYFWDDHKYLKFNECVTLAIGYKMTF